MAVGVKAAQVARAKIRTANSNKRKEAATKDPETGFALKQSDMTPEEDCKAVNPGYGDLGRDYSHNCMYCTTAFELRQRGFDVTANKLSSGTTDDLIKELFPNSKEPTSMGFSSEHLNILTLKSASKMVKEQARETLFKEPEGSRGNLMVMWTMGAGHSVAYIIENGKPVIYDSQVGKVYKDVDKLLSKCSYAQYVRLDNCEIDKTKIKGAVN